MSEKLPFFDSIDNSHIGAIASLEHGDCSISASSANMAVRQLMFYDNIKDKNFVINNVAKERNVYAIDETDQIKKETVQIIETNQYVFVDSQQIVLAFMQPHEVQKAPAETLVDTLLPTQKRRLLGRKALDAKTAISNIPPSDVEAKDPLLVGLIGDDIYFPLASFSNRQDQGACEFIQLGREVHDDNFFVTSQDEKGARHVVVEAIRGLATGQKYNQDHPKYVALSNFVESEMAYYRAMLLDKKEAQLIRIVLNTPAATEKKLHVVDEERQVLLSKHRLSGLSPKLVTPSGRTIQLVVGNSTNTELKTTPATIFAITRDNIAVPLIDLMPHNGTLKHSDQQVPDELPQRENRTNALLDLANKKLAISTGQIKYIDGSFKQLEPIDFAVTQWGIKKGYINEYMYPKSKQKYNDYFNEQYTDGESKYVATQAAKDLYAYLDKNIIDIIRNTPEDKQSAPIKFIADYIRLQNQIHQPIIDVLNIDQRLDSVLGETDTYQEALLNKIIVMNIFEHGTAYRGMLKNVPLPNNGVLADIDIESYIRFDGTHGSLTIYGRPVSQPTAPVTSYMELQFDTTRPLLANYPKRGAEFAQDWYNILLQINSPGRQISGGGAES